MQDKKKSDKENMKVNFLSVAEQEEKQEEFGTQSLAPPELSIGSSMSQEKEEEEHIQEKQIAGNRFGDGDEIGDGGESGGSSIGAGGAASGGIGAGAFQLKRDNASDVVQQKSIQNQEKPTESYQLKSAGERHTDTTAPPSEPYQLKSNSSSSNKLPDDVRGKMENAFQYDFSNVDIQKNSSEAKRMGALAFAKGNEVHFAPGQFEPYTPKGQELIGHELTHIVQQSENRVKPTVQAKGVAINDDKGLEREADEMGKKVAQQSTGNNSNASKGNLSNNLNETVQRKEVVQMNMPVEQSGGAEGNEQEVPDSPDNSALGGVETTIQEPPREVIPEKGDEEIQGTEELKETPQEENPELPGSPDDQPNDGQNEKKPALDKKSAKPKVEGAGNGQQLLGNSVKNAEKLGDSDITFKEITLESLKGETPVQLKTETEESILAEINEKKRQSEEIANQFFSEAPATATGLSSISGIINSRIQGAVASARELISSAVTNQVEKIKAKAAAVKENAKAKAEAAKSNIESTYDELIEQIKTDTEQKRTELEEAVEEITQALSEAKVAETEVINGIYQEGDIAYREAGVTVGDEAVAIGADRAANYRSQKINRRDSWKDGHLTDRRCEARAKAAEQVADSYKTGLIDEANKQADEAQKGLPKDLEVLATVESESLEILKASLETAVESLTTQETAAIDAANEAKTNLIDALEEATQNTIQAVEELEADQVSNVQQTGEEQAASFANAGQKTIGSLCTKLAQSVDGLTKGLADLQTQLAGAETPDPEALKEALDQSRAELESNAEQIKSQFESSISSAVSGLLDGAGKTVEAINKVGQQTVETLTEIEGKFEETVQAIEDKAESVANEMLEGHTTVLEEIGESAITNFEAILTAAEEQYIMVSDNVQKAFDEAVPAFADALRGCFPDMEALINEKAEEAASKEQPAWKSVLKWVLIIVIIIVVALVLGPFVIGAVGAAAGALGASAAVAGALGAIIGGAIVGAISSAAIQIVNNWAAGESLLNGVGKAALIGAIGGALGGAAGLAIQKVSSVVVQFGLGALADIAVDTAINLALGEFTWEGLLTSAVMAIFTSAGGTLLTKTDFGARIEASSQAAGESFGTGAVNRFRPNTASPTAGTTNTNSGNNTTNQNGNNTTNQNGSNPTNQNGNNTTNQNGSNPTNQNGNNTTNQNGTSTRISEADVDNTFKQYQEENPYGSFNRDRVRQELEAGRVFNPETGRFRKPPEGSTTTNQAETNTTNQTRTKPNQNESTTIRNVSDSEVDNTFRQYQEENPHGSFTRDRVRQELEAGRVFNPETGRFRKPDGNSSPSNKELEQGKDLHSESYFNDKTDVETQHNLQGQAGASDCAVTSFDTLLKDFGIDSHSTLELAQAMDYDPFSGTSISKIPDALESLGITDIKATYHKEGMTISELSVTLADGGTAIVSVNDGQGAHAVIIDSIKDGQVTVRDPLPIGTGASYTIPLATFESSFTRFNSQSDRGLVGKVVTFE